MKVMQSYSSPLYFGAAPVLFPSDRYFVQLVICVFNSVIRYISNHVFVSQALLSLPAAFHSALLSFCNSRLHFPNESYINIPIDFGLIWNV